MTFDVAIVGGGLAGLVVAELVDRSGRSAVLIDSNQHSPSDFRCEKFEHRHAALLNGTPILDVVHANSTLTRQLWIARFGELLDVTPFDQFGFRYGDLINALRESVGASVVRRQATVQRIARSGNRTVISGTQGLEVEARLVIVATGLNPKLRNATGAVSRVVSRRHSICMGFDLVSLTDDGFRFPALQYNAEKASPNVGYLSLFQIGAAMRANLFLYHSIDDDIVSQFRARPEAALHALFPKLHRMIGASQIVGPVICRPSDVCMTTETGMDGVVMIGDAYMTVCPATGLGALKAMNDALCLCADHLDDWLESGEVSARAIQDFYHNPRKQKADREALSRGNRLKDLATRRTFRTASTRWALYQSRLVRGWARAVRTGVDMRTLRLAGQEMGDPAMPKVRPSPDRAAETSSA